MPTASPTETFAVNLNAFETETDPRWTCEEALGLNITSCAVWSLSNALGCYAAAYLNPPTELVSYLLIAMFLGIWVNYLTDRKNDHHRAGVRASSDPAFADRSL